MSHTKWCSPPSRRADTAVTWAAQSSLPSCYTENTAQSSPAARASFVCSRRGLCCRASAVFQYREKHHKHRASNRALLHPSVEAGTAELWAPGQLQWPHAGQVTGMGWSRHLFRSRSCKNLGNLGNSVASALVSLFSAGQCHPLALVLMALYAVIQVNIPSFPLMPWEGCGESRHFCASGSCCLLLKQEVVQNPAGSYKQRGIPGTCFGELFCWVTAEKKRKTKHLQYFALIQRNKLHRN